MVSNKFDPCQGWLPPSFTPVDKQYAKNPDEIEVEDSQLLQELQEDRTLVETGAIDGVVRSLLLINVVLVYTQGIDNNIFYLQLKVATGWDEPEKLTAASTIVDGVESVDLIAMEAKAAKEPWQQSDSYMAIPYNIYMQHVVSDKSVADAIEALIGLVRGTMISIRQYIDVNTVIFPMQVSIY